jgi:hypothetical protein
VSLVADMRHLVLPEQAPQRYAILLRTPLLPH